MLKIAVCDDEEYYLRKIAESLRKEFAKKSICDYLMEEYTSGVELLKADNLPFYDIIFLDINMPGENGMRTAEKIREIRPEVILVFITAFVDYAVEGYKAEAIRFLLKDMLEHSLPECVDAIARKLSLQTCKVKCNEKGREKEIPVSWICFIESKAHKLLFHLAGAGAEKYSKYGKLDHMADILSEYGFLRIHKSFLVNIKNVDEIVNYTVRLKDGRQLPIPREKFGQIKERYYEMMGDML